MSILNWSAPATQSDKAQEAQGTVFAQLVGQSPENIGLLLCPVFHYKRNQIFSLEHCMVKGLASRGVEVDCQASLIYKDKTDLRDGRPLVYPLRVVRPLTACLVEDEGDQVKVDRKLLVHSAFAAEPADTGSGASTRQEAAAGRGPE